MNKFNSLTKEEQDLLEICIRIEQQKEEQFQEVGIPLYAPMPVYEEQEREEPRPNQIIIQL